MLEITNKSKKQAFFLAELLKKEGFSLTYRRRLKREGRFYAEGKEIAFASQLEPGQTVKAYLPVETKIQPQNGPLEIIYEDAYLIALNKPPGQLTHPAQSELTGTLANYLLGYLAKKSGWDGIHFISRLDRDTSGLVLAAKSAHIKHLFSKSKAEKRYLALLSATPPAELGLVDLGIARKEGSIIEREVSLQGKRSLSFYKVIEQYPNGWALAHLQPITGRTHQLRLHAKALGCPLVGESLYTGECGKSRQLLHASELVFTHPVSKEKLQLVAPLPEDMKQFLQRFS